jgi:hypothetical protein
MATHQTVRLGVGKHDRPGRVVCVMELASMLGGERFTDRPASVCPVIGAILRVYNDNLDDRLRGDLYRYAAEAVGTRADFALQRRRAQKALEWARAGHDARRRLRRAAAAPDPDWTPVKIAEYVVASLGRTITAEGHTAMLRLLDELIGLGLSRELVEHLPHAVEHRGCGEQLVVGEVGQCPTPAGLDLLPASVDGGAPALGQRRQHDALVAI